MEYATIAGNYYTITSKSGCSVTDATGTLSMTVDAGGQLTVQAPSDKLVYDDEQAIVFKANFKSALAALGLLGGGADKLPAGYTRLAFLQGTGQQYINTQATGKETSEVICTFERLTDGGKAVYTQNANETTHMLNCFVWGVFENLRYDWGAKNYVASGKYPGGWVTTVQSANGVTLNGEQILPTFESQTFTSAALVLFSNRANVGTFTADNVRMARWALKTDGKPVRDMVPVLDSSGVPCMYDRVTRTAYRRSGTGQFIAGMTLSQVRGLRLPAGGGELTLSLPHEASIDRLAQAALERARANGWELTLQYAEAEVPAGYRKLDFLESTGTQYIDTGVKLSSESVIEVSAALANDSTASIAVWGSYSSEDKYSLFWHLAKQEGVDAPIGQFQGVTWFGSTTIAEVGKKYQFKQTRGELWIDGELAKARDIEDFSLDFSAALFCIKQQVEEFYYRSSSRIYSFTISSAGETQVDYVPCITPDGKLGMYNKVDGTLQENAGTGAFVAGLATIDDVRNLWLPETGGELTVSVPADTPDSAVEQLRTNNPSWQIAIQYRTDNEN